jgi:hypothetical protein
MFPLLISPQRYERGLVRVFAHLRNRDSAQYVQNTFVHAAQRLADRTLLRGVAVPVARNAGGDQHRAIDGRNYIERGDLAGLLGQLVAAAGTVLRGHERMMRQLLQHFGHERRGNAIFFGDFIRTAGVLRAMHRQMLHGNQAIVGLF